jgi:sugar O-acyltransferase (sialic acid O-acetyltransferase NeuD family)
MNNIKLLFFGAGGHAAKMNQLAINEGLSVEGHISTEKKGTSTNGIFVLGDINFYIKNKDLHDHWIHIAIGENSVRHKIFNDIGSLNENLHSIISSHAVINGNVVIDKGTGVLQSAIIQNNVKIGKCCLIDTGAIIEHDTTVGDFVNIGPGAIVASHIKIRRHAVIGIGATVIERCEIGEGALIGAGAVVINDIEPYTIAVGNPASVIKKRKFTDKYFR